MNILMPYHFGKLMTWTKSWHIFSGANSIQTYFSLPSAVLLINETEKYAKISIF